MINLYKLSPYHITTLANLENILYRGLLASKNTLKQEGVIFQDLGELEEKNPSIALTIYKITKQTDLIVVTYKIREIDLRNFVRLYLFVARDRMNNFVIPKFLYTVARRCKNFCILLFKSLQEIIEWTHKEGSEYLLIYGHPHRKNPTGFADLDSMINYFHMNLPGVDGLKEWLKYTIESYDELALPLDYFVAFREPDHLDRYLAYLLASELLIRDKLPITLLSKILVLIRDESEIEDLKRLKRIEKFLKLTRSHIQLKTYGYERELWEELYFSVWPLDILLR